MVKEIKSAIYYVSDSKEDVFFDWANENVIYKSGFKTSFSEFYKSYQQYANKLDILNLNYILNRRGFSNSWNLYIEKHFQNYPDVSIKRTFFQLHYFNVGIKTKKFAWQELIEKVDRNKLFNIM